MDKDQLRKRMDAIKARATAKAKRRDEQIARRQAITGRHHSIYVTVMSGGRM